MLDLFRQTIAVSTVSFWSKLVERNTDLTIGDLRIINKVRLMISLFQNSILWLFTDNTKSATENTVNDSDVWLWSNWWFCFTVKSITVTPHRVEVWWKHQLVNCLQEHIRCVRIFSKIKYSCFPSYLLILSLCTEIFSVMGLYNVTIDNNNNVTSRWVINWDEMTLIVIKS